MRLTRTPLLVAATLAAILLPRAARADEHTFALLVQQLRRGEPVFVVDRAGHEIAGALTRASSTSLTIAVGDQDREVLAGDIGRVETRGDSVWNGAAIGAAFVTPIWLSEWSFVCGDRPTAGCRASSAAGTILPFVGVGALIDRAHEGRRQRYAAEPIPDGPVSSMADLWQKTRSGETVYITDNFGQVLTGTFVEAGPASLMVVVSGDHRELAASSVRQLARRGDSVKEGLIIGMVFGAVEGGVGGPELSTVSAAFWGGIGALIDAGIHGKTTIYKPGTGRHATITPAIGVRSARLVVSF